MERLTGRKNGVCTYVGPGCAYPETGEIPAEMAVESVRVTLQTLAAYEDTGLMPEEIIALCEMDRRAKMAEFLRTEDYRDAEAYRAGILEDAVRTWGRDAQALMMIEEMSELTKAICKFFRARDDKSVEVAVEDIREEIADVQIMLDQMKIVFGGVKEQERAKLDRLEKRLERAHAAEAGKC